LGVGGFEFLSKVMLKLYLFNIDDLIFNIFFNPEQYSKMKSCNELKEILNIQS